MPDVIFYIPVESSLRPDGFGSGFYRACWDIVENDVVDAVIDFFLGMPLPRFYTTSSIVLILKVSNPTGFDKFRSISLCLVIYKTCSKFLVLRLAPMLNSIISLE